MLTDEVQRRAGASFCGARRLDSGVWALTPHVLAVSAKPDLIANIGRAIAQGLRAISPDPW